MLESIAVAVIVCAAACCAVWTLVPPVRRLFGVAPKAGACGGCDGCGSTGSKAAAASASPAEHPIRIVRRQLPTRPDRIA